MKNKAGINMTPCKAIFGVDSKVGLTTTNLPDDVIDIINVENNLKNSTNTQTRCEDRTNQKVSDMFFTSFTFTK